MMSPKRKRKRLVKIVISYSIGILLVAGSTLLIVNFSIPRIAFKFFPERVPYPSNFHSEAEVLIKEIPTDNRLVIPKIGVDINIVEGDTEESLNLGAWHYPGSASPGDGGNIVITGHRFQFRPPNDRTFYLLDKLELHDEIIIYWEGQEHDYTVSGVYEVTPEQIEILNTSSEEKLTLFTCTPLFSQDKRLVVEGKPLVEL